MLAISLIQNKEHHGKANFEGGTSLAEQNLREYVLAKQCVFWKI